MSRTRKKKIICQGWCAHNKENLTVHHIIPRRFGGCDRVENLQILCRNCHDWVEVVLGEIDDTYLDNARYNYICFSQFGHEYVIRADVDDLPSGLRKKYRRAANRLKRNAWRKKMRKIGMERVNSQNELS